MLAYGVVATCSTRSNFTNVEFTLAHSSRQAVRHDREGTVTGAGAAYATSAARKWEVNKKWDPTIKPQDRASVTHPLQQYTT